MRAQFTLYAIHTEGPPVLDMEHTYVLSGNHNWNCFGRGAETLADSRQVLTASGSAKWASLVYGKDEGVQESGSAAGLHIRYDGVCQNAANRILVLAGDYDARETKGNILATLMYGRFGFNLAEYIDAVKKTGAQLLQEDPEEISADDIRNVLDRIARGQSPNAELETIHADAKEQWGNPLPDLTDAQRDVFCPIYADYQKAREEAFGTLAATTNPNVQIALKELPSALAGPWTTCVDKLVAKLGAEQFLGVFGVVPDLAKRIFGTS